MAAEAVAPALPWAWPVGVLLLLGLVGVLASLWWRQRQATAALRAELASSQEQASQLTRSQHDDPQVPGLLLRPRFDELLRRAAGEVARRQGSLVLLFINLDNFRSVNDGQGYRAGDQLIVEVARRLTASCSGELVAARLGVDEFLLLHRADLASARVLAGQLCTALALPYVLAGRPVSGLGASIGLAAYPQHGPRGRLVAHASMAMQSVKRSGGGGFAVFEPAMAVDQRDQASLLADLREAVTRGELELYYQPKVEARLQRITAAEALLRWHHPQRGMVSPAVFIPIAERAGLIGALGNWVIDDACRQAGAWRDEGLRMRVAINLSAYQMRQDDLVDRILAALQRHRLRPERFTVEITESVAMEDTQVTQRSFERLRAAGLHVSIDDFGVGQASLSYLRRLPAAELKIDASFVRDLASSADARAIVDAVVRLAHALGLKVVAEGVETEAQREQLVRLGCDELQGFLFAKPMSAQALGTWARLDADTPARSAQFSPSLFEDTRPQAELLALAPLPPRR